MNRILVLSKNSNDLSELIIDNCKTSVVCNFDNIDIDFNEFDALCILGGTEEKPLTLPAPLRIKTEDFIEKGKPVFCEFISSVSCVYCDKPTKTTHHRMVYSDEYVKFAPLDKGDILDGHYNDIIPYYFVPSDSIPILTYHDYLCAHDNIEMDSETFKSGKWALWKLNDNTLVSSFRICNFNRARLAPRKRWLDLINGIVNFLCGETVNLTFPSPICTTNNNLKDISATVKSALNWFINADMLKSNGKMGVREGFSHLISAQDGTQLRADSTRTDCTGETGGAFLLDYLVTGNESSYEIFKNTESFCFEYMQIKNGKHKGMLRWTESAWEVCYQDDVARAILPTLLCQNFSKGSKYFNNAVETLEYLANTTGNDGLRVIRTECCNLDENKLSRLKKSGTGIPCAHYNAYYHAALLLAVRAGADKKFADIAVKGLTSIMNLYPDTRRETSETEELCRLVFPLALLFEYTKKEEHYKWLKQVVKDLERFQHPSGGYAEWDTDYKAACSRNNNGECALLANNGDPVADLLYSNNWLPLGFSYAYMVTKEDYFHKKWEEIATFMVNAQMHSEDKLLNGAWTRAIDMDRMESYGVPHDVGWAPCCIESGWTVAEILMGLQFMTLAEKLK